MTWNVCKRVLIEGLAGHFGINFKIIFCKIKQKEGGIEYIVFKFIGFEPSDIHCEFINLFISLQIIE